MNPFAVLGLRDNAPIEEALKVWRRLRTKLHPDHGGDEEKFRTAKDAWEKIEAGYRIDFNSESLRTQQKQRWTAPQDVQGSWRSKLNPSTEKGESWFNKFFGKTAKAGQNQQLKLTIRVTQKQANEGCLASFVYNCEVRYLTIPPMTRAGEFQAEIRESEIIGAINTKTRKITINLEVTP